MKERLERSSLITEELFDTVCDFYSQVEEPLETLSDELNWRYDDDNKLKFDDVKPVLNQMLEFLYQFIIRFEDINSQKRGLAKYIKELRKVTLKFEKVVETITAFEDV